MWKIWLLFAGFFLILEIITSGFLVFWFAIGAIITMIFSLFIDNIIVTDLPPKTDLGIRTGKYNFYFKRTQPMIDLMH